MSRRKPETVLPERYLISTTKAAEYLDVSPGTIRQYIADGKLPCQKVGRLIKETPEIEALIVTVDNS